ncbi:hypothetical protein BJX63DRAFT_405942 [Aspergillus granulosus]|uniref:DUF7703 domain-containing protein n=1 Tax=Aspergillus granulosus TaxID=176169 RepID=A0ABR4H1M7_9EURO
MVDNPRTEPGGEHTTPPTYAFLNVAFLAVAGYNTLELLIWIFHFFKRRRGLYFWSILISTISIGLFALLAFLQFFRLASFRFTGPGIAIALPAVFCAQTLVLYSRLHLITAPGALLRFVLWVIIITSIVLLLPFTILLAGLSTGNTRFAVAERYAERYTITGTVIREVLICALYIYQSARQLEPIIELKGTAGKRIMINMIVASIAVIVLDIFALLILYQGQNGMSSAYTCMSQSVKLRMEFAVLNSLLELLGAPMAFCREIWDANANVDMDMSAGAGWDSGQASRTEMVQRPERLWGVRGSRYSV